MEVSREYKKTKSLFRKASDSKKRTDWLHAHDAYEKYTKLYGQDIDALLEFGEICTHLDDWDGAIKHFTTSSKYQEKNPFHLVRIGEVYARKRNYNKMKQKFWDLFKQDDTNKTYLRNYAIACVKDRDIDNIKELVTTHRKKLQEIILPTRDKTKEPRNLLDTLNDSLHKLEKDPKEPHHDLDKDIVYRKGKGGENSLLNQEQRLGVLLLLQIYPGITKERIRDEWLKNANTTTDILEELITREEIEKVKLPPVEMYYLTETGSKNWDVKKMLENMSELFEAKKKDKKIEQIVPFGPMFTDRLVDKVALWNWFKTHGKILSGPDSPERRKIRRKMDESFSEDLRTDMDKFYPEQGG